jgi:hypothetical protein
VQAGKETVAVEVSVAEIHATTIRKLDRNGSSANTGEELSEEASDVYLKANLDSLACKLDLTV